VIFEILQVHQNDAAFAAWMADLVMPDKRQDALAECLDGYSDHRCGVRYRAADWLWWIQRNFTGVVGVACHETQLNTGLADRQASATYIAKIDAALRLN
jgi:hypothetical protein